MSSYKRPAMAMDDDENTAVFEMKQAMADFMKNPTSNIRAQLSFGAGSLLDSSPRSADTSRKNASSVSMQQLFDKENKEKERHLELIQAKTQITDLQGRLSSLETTRKRARVEYEQEITSARQEAQREMDSSDRLKTQLSMLLSREDDIQSQLKQTRTELRTTKASYERKVLDLQKEKHKLEMSIQEIEQESSTKLMELKNSNLRKDSELQISRLELEEVTQRLQKATKRYNDAKVELQESEQSRVLAAEQKVKELESQISQMEGDAVIARTMKDQLDKLRGLEKQNRTLASENSYWKDTQENVFLLREEAESLKMKLERAEQRCVEYNRLQLENQDMKKRLSQWEALSDNTNRPLCPTELKRRISDLQASNASLLEQQGNLQTGSHSLESRYSTLDKQLKATTDQLAQTQVKGQQLETLVTRLKKKLLLIMKERDSYKGILDSYENEMTSLGSSSGSHSALSSSPGVTSQLRGLQEALAGCQAHIGSLEGALERTEGDLGQTQARARLLESQVISQRQQRHKAPSVSEDDNPVILQLRQQVVDLEKRLEESQAAKQEVDDALERQTLQGGYDSALTKVVHFSNNPVAMAQRRRQEEASAALEENAKLRARVELLEQRGEVDDLTQRVEQQREEQPGTSGGKELEEMASQVKSAELKNQRLMEVFKKKSHELREAVYQLLGFMIHIPCDNQYRLMNMYAEQPNDYLLFQQDSEGQFQMLSTDYSATLEDKMETYLIDGNSIPAFLSSTTVDLFSRQTVME